jgi:hypothetical protein
MKNMFMKKSIAQDERGIVSLLVVSILAVVISLVAIGFSHLSNRELRQALDRELSSQAYYAAEAGIDDARAYLAAGGTAFSGCQPPAGSPYFTSSLDGSGVVKYSCISVIDAPQTLSYNLDAGESKVIKINAAGLKNLYIGWENRQYSKSGPQWLGSVGNLPREQGLNADVTGLVRLGIYPVPAGSADNDALASLSRAYFLYPNSGSGSPGQRDYTGGSYSSGGTGTGPSGNNGDFIPGNCKNSNPKPNPLPSNDQAILSYCNSEITNLNNSNNLYYLYITARYADLYVRIQGTDGSGKPVKFTGSQGVIDVTGKGTDELQRLRARIDLGNQYNWPSEAIHSMDGLCKDFSLDVVAQGQFDNPQVLDQSDTACQAPSGGGSFVSSGSNYHP